VSTGSTAYARPGHPDASGHGGPERNRLLVAALGSAAAAVRERGNAG
jgi:hypothetical protein